MYELATIRSYSLLTSIALLCAPHIPIPNGKKAREMKSITRRPKIFARWPESGRKVAPASAYADPIHTILIRILGLQSD
jgi:hypothetical protein